MHLLLLLLQLEVQNEGQHSDSISHAEGGAAVSQQMHELEVETHQILPWWYPMHWAKTFHDHLCDQTWQPVAETSHQRSGSRQKAAHSGDRERSPTHLDQLVVMLMHHQHQNDEQHHPLRGLETH